MKRKLFALVGVLTLITYSIGCSKNSHEQPNTKKVNVQSITSSTSCTPENSLNPYDHIGEKHNLGVYAVVNDQDLDNGSYQTISNSLSQWWTDNDNSVYDEESAMYTMTTVEGDYVNNFSNIIQNSSFSNHAKSYLTYMINISLNPPQGLTYCQLYQMLITAENEIIADQNLNNNERSKLLTAYAIGRYSAYNPPIVDPYVTASISRGWVTFAYDVMGYIMAYENAEANNNLENRDNLALQGAIAASSCWCLPYNPW
ncbi:hypothetical protein DBR32_03305 [Taibaiella sp. KBW10]|uniref:hypothetical protein n=1 Tax=Taibaiella sp. KBW10 TaxID=2153357 RepID=UPI000F5B7109|nr:hypothetical protein [Taibaiella sp. KBW10]RQO32633.1 hypothetical protein DBR32_03305 [Taibaiella sp. KBW10]